MFWFSIALVFAAVVSIFVYGLNFGVDFKGGTVIELEFIEVRPDVASIQEALATQNMVISSSGDNEVIIRAGQMTETEHQELLSRLQTAFPQAGLVENKFDSVGPVIGEELRSKSVQAIILVLVAITIYMTIVFRRISGTVPSWMMGVAAIIALLHDVVIPTGVFAWLGHAHGVEISAVFVAAVLTILGYSVSDTVVVFDRVRENVIKGGPKEDFGLTVHKSVMQTLTRSINTSVATLLSMVAVYLFGGASIHYFALAFIMGIFLGAYSSIFVASPLLVWMSSRNRKSK